MKDFIKLYSILEILGKGYHAIWLFIMMLVGMCFELLSIGLIIPVVGVLTENNILEAYPILEPLIKWLNYPSQYDLILFSMISLIVIYGIKSVFLSYLAWDQSRFSFIIQAEVSQALFSGYLKKPWTFYIQKNSAQLIRNLTSESNLFAGSAVTPVLHLLTEIVVVIGISILLFLVEPVLTIIIVFSFTIFGFLTHIIFRNKISKWGQLRQMHEGMRIQFAQQGLGGVKDLKILGREDGITNQYFEHNFGSADVSTKKAIITLLPRLWLEFIAIISLGLGVIIMLNLGRPVSSLFSMIAIFGVASFRIMPSVNRIVTSMQNFRYGIPVIHNIYDEINAIEKLPTSNSVNIKFKEKIVVKKVFFKYPNSQKNSLQDINMIIPYGSSVGLIGGSGMGKSTLIDVILGLLDPDSGSILVDGIDIKKQLRGWQDNIGYVSQSIFLSDDSLRKNIAFGLPDSDIDENKINRVLKASELLEFVEQLPNGLNTFVGERGIRISGGQRQRIGIARALYNNPKVLVLDEATSSLDVETESKVMDSVYALKDVTLIIIAHRLSTVNHCDKIYSIKSGVLSEGKN